MICYWFSQVFGVRPAHVQQCIIIGLCQCGQTNTAFLSATAPHPLAKNLSVNISILITSTGDRITMRFWMPQHKTQHRSAASAGSKRNAAPVPGQNRELCGDGVRRDKHGAARSAVRTETAVSTASEPLAELRQGQVKLCAYSLRAECNLHSVESGG